MTALIARLRRLIGDADESNQVWTDDEIESVLDRHREWVQYEPLRPSATRTPGGSVEYRDHFAALTDWEEDAALCDAAFNILTPDASDWQTGHWRFNSPGKLPPILITGKSYDLCGAAVDVLERWAAREKLAFDFATDGQSFRESQKAAALLTLAGSYRQQMRAGRGSLLNTDFNAVVSG